LTFKTPLKNDRINDRILAVKFTSASHRRYKIGLPFEGLKQRGQDNNNV